MNTKARTVLHKSLLGAAFTSAALLAGCAEPPPPPPPQPVLVMEIVGSSGLSERSFPGRAEASQQVNLSFRVSGPLVEFPVAVGDQVSAGDLLAKIDPQDFSVRLASLESLESAADAALQRAQADYERLRNAQSEDPGATSQRAVDLALAARDEARGAVSAARANSQTARDRLGYTELKAPFAGEVVETYVENFETVLAKQPILRLLDPTLIEMTVSVPESLIGYADFITGIMVEFDAIDGVRIPATVKEIGRESTRATRTYPITIVMEQPPTGEVLPGMAGNAVFSARLPEDALTGLQVPGSAIFAGNDTSQTFVWIVTDDTVERRQVEVESLTSTGVIVTSGLNPGDVIVRAGVHSLSDGQAIRVIQEDDSQ